MMRVAYVCTDPGVPVFGRKGGSIHVQEVIRGFLRRGADVTLFARRVGGEAPEGLERVTLRRLSPAPSGTGEDRERFLMEANEELRDMLSCEPGIDFVYERHALWSYGAMEHARSRDMPALLEVNAPLIEEQRAYRTLCLAGEASEAADRAFGAASAVLAVSGPLADWLGERGSAAGKVHVLPNGVDVKRFAPDVPPSLPEAGAVTIGFVGSLRPWHGAELLAGAFSTLRREGLPVRLLMVGDGPAREQVERACAGHEGAVVMTGAVEPHEVPGLLTSMDIAVAPYPQMDRFYFSPLKLFEYMGAGRAIVASGLGQVREVIFEGDTGLLYDPGDEGALTFTLRHLALDPPLRWRLGSAARLAAVADHRWELVVDRILGLARPAGRAAV